MCNVTEDLWCMMKHSAISMQPDGSEEPRSIGTSVSCNGRLSQVLSTNFIICLSTLSASVVINVIYLAFFCCCVFFKLDILQVSTSYQFNLYCPGIWDKFPSTRAMAAGSLFWDIRTEKMWCQASWSRTCTVPVAQHTANKGWNMCTLFPAKLHRTSTVASKCNLFLLSEPIRLVTTEERATRSNIIIKY